MDAARVLRNARRSAGLSQADLARRCGVPAQVVNRIERGLVDPRVRTLDRLLAGAGADLDLTRRRGAAVPRGAIRELLAQPPRQRFTAASLEAIDMLCRRRVRFVLAGAAAARYHGTPARVERLEIALESHHTNARLFTIAARAPAIHTSVRPAPQSFSSLRGNAEPFSWLPSPRRRVLNAWIDAPTGYVASLDDLIDAADNADTELLVAVREELDRTDPGSRIYRSRFH